MSKSTKANVNRTDLAISDNPVLPDIDNKLQQAFSRLLIWDAQNEIWRLALSDVDGRLLVSSSPTQGVTANQPQVTVGVTTIQLLGANPSRRLFMIQNLGAAAIYLNFGNPAVVATSFQVPAGGTFIDDHFTGAINAISGSAGNDVRIVEF